jgi:predicted TIM-barrel enzyme
LRHDEEQVARMVADVALPKVKEVHVNVGVFSTDPFWRTENLIAMEC